MRLLDTRTLDLVDVRDDAVPPYAILSHTWGQEEISLHELQWLKSRLPRPLDKRKRKVSEMAGFRKVKEAAAVALRRGYSFIWVDTCCIDKSSSAELSEAINSMYAWYKQSAECYAYLSDVESSTWNMFESNLRGSRWFTRGWTLQELIAPRSVFFFNKNWDLLGHKDDPPNFTKELSYITGIDEEVLDGRIDPLQLSISARMQWASLRSTTRPEDEAYSLMGLFQVNMPLLYGEGQRAFARLQEAIIQSTDDQSLFAWNSYGNVEEDPDALSGLLAHSTSLFRFSAGIQPLPPSPVYASSPSAITNHGLRVQLYLRRIIEDDEVPMEEDYWAILDCFVRGADGYVCPALRLRRLSQDQYARLQTKTRKWLPPPQSEYAADFEGYRTIYVRQQPVYYHLPQFRVSRLHMMSAFNALATEDQDYQLTDIYPPRKWNSTTMTMSVEYSRKLQAMGLFRFQSSNPHNQKIDIVVGLRRLDAMQWEGWCFQLACKEESLETTLSKANQKIANLARTRNTSVTAPMLRNLLGDDSKLGTEATVEGIQIQGRLYISISMSMKSEIQSGREIPLHPELNVGPTARVAEKPAGLDVVQLMKTYTSPLWVTDPRLSESEELIWTTEVRANLAPNGRPIDIVTHVTKNLSHFLGIVRADQEHPPIIQTEIEKNHALALASFEGDQVRIRDLLQRGADPGAYAADVYGLPALHWAIAGGSRTAVSLLLQSGASPIQQARVGWSALHVSVMFSRSMWDLLSANCTSDDSRNLLAVSRSAITGDAPLHLASAFCQNNYTGVSFFTQLASDLEAYTSISIQNKIDETPLHRAAASGNDQIIAAICRQEGWDSLTLSARLNQADVLGRTALWHAAATGSIGAVQQLLALGAAVDQSDNLGRTPLHAAARGGHASVLNALLSAGASPSIQTSSFELTPLQYAVMFGHFECLRTLINISVYPASRMAPPVPENVFALDRNRALHFAASCGWIKCVKLLCETGADPFLPQPNYLRLEKTKKHAILITTELDASEVAALEGHDHITDFFETSDACASARRRKQGLPEPISQISYEQQEYSPTKPIEPRWSFDVGRPDYAQGYRPPPINSRPTSYGPPLSLEAPPPPKAHSAPTSYVPGNHVSELTGDAMPHLPTQSAPTRYDSQPEFFDAKPRPPVQSMPVSYTPGHQAAGNPYTMPQAPAQSAPVSYAPGNQVGEIAPPQQRLTAPSSFPPVATLPPPPSLPQKVAGRNSESVTFPAYSSPAYQQSFASRISGSNTSYGPPPQQSQQQPTSSQPMMTTPAPKSYYGPYQQSQPVSSYQAPTPYFVENSSSDPYSFPVTYSAPLLDPYASSQQQPQQQQQQQQQQQPSTYRPPAIAYSEPFRSLHNQDDQHEALGMHENFRSMLGSIGHAPALRPLSIYDNSLASGVVATGIELEGDAPPANTPLLVNGEPSVPPTMATAASGTEAVDQFYTVSPASSMYSTAKYAAGLPTHPESGDLPRTGEPSPIISPISPVSSVILDSDSLRGYTLVWE
ncbi:hypothetical protein BX600DRAFT_477473 [Xylariales sp. PMI_506]|nr:hypothetical protein BX600DRAFT_477473 [Xylariales sp. PMI_506]